MKPEFHSEVAEKIFEVLTSGELAARLKVKESWIIDQSKRCKTPIPFRFSGWANIGGIAGARRNCASW